MTEGRGT